MGLLGIQWVVWCMMTLTCHPPQEMETVPKVAALPVVDAQAMLVGLVTLHALVSADL